ncbi:putative Glycoside hydrolase, family 13-like [Verrucomicrobia bacterium]|nr:putative Glycoside hydrolase, family 13-like [Verrucomicrobiota bacterium]
METRHTHATTVARPVAPTDQRRGERPNERPIDFILNVPTAHEVALVGAFNDWDLKRTPMHKDPVVGWRTTIWLPKGRYEYRFVADGEWINDPTAKETVGNAFGSTNSVLQVH